MKGQALPERGHLTETTSVGTMRYGMVSHHQEVPCHVSPAHFCYLWSLERCLVQREPSVRVDGWMNKLMEWTEYSPGAGELGESDMAPDLGGRQPKKNTN